MATRTTIQRAASQAAPSPAKPQGGGIQSVIRSMMPGIKDALPSVITPERFTRICLSAVSKDPRLAENVPSFLASMMTAAQLGLEPNTPLGHAYLIGYRDHGKMTCQFQLGYKGLIDLAYRSGSISVIQAHTVYEQDEFAYELGLEPKLTHKPALSDRGEPIAYYAMFRMKDGGYGFEVMSHADVEAHAKKFSQSYGKGYSSPWTTNFEEMAKKTVIKKALKYAPMKSEFVRALAADETIRSDISADFMNDIVRAPIPVNPDTGEVETVVVEDTEPQILDAETAPNAV